MTLCKVTWQAHQVRMLLEAVLPSGYMRSHSYSAESEGERRPLLPTPQNTCHLKLLVSLKVKTTLTKQNKYPQHYQNHSVIWKMTLTERTFHTTLFFNRHFYNQECLKKKEKKKKKKKKAKTSDPQITYCFLKKYCLIWILVHKPFIFFIFVYLLKNWNKKKQQNETLKGCYISWQI